MTAWVLTLMILSFSYLRAAAAAAGFVLPRNLTVEATTHRDPFTIVTGYFRVPGKRPDTAYFRNMNRTLRINASYHFFYHDDDVREAATAFRSDYPGKTVFTYVPLDMIERLIFGTGEAFTSNKLKFKELHHHPFAWPLIVIWLSKFNLMRMSRELNPYQSQWFMWLDVTLNALRYGEGVPQTAYPDPIKLAAVPRNKVIYSAVHEASANCMTGSFLMHADFVPVFGKLFDKELHPTCFGSKNMVCLKTTLPDSTRHRVCRYGCGDDQAYMKWLKHARPDYFEAVNCAHHYNNMTFQMANQDANFDYCGHVRHCGWAGLLASLYAEPTSKIGMCTKNPSFC